MKKQITLLLILLCVCLPFTVFANDDINVAVSSEDYAVTVSGNLGVEAANRIVTLALVSPAKDISSINIDEVLKGKTDIISDFYLTYAKDDGSYEFNPFLLWSDGGDYTILVNADNLSKPKSAVKYLPSKIQIDTIVKTINEGDTDDIFTELEKENTKIAVANIADISVYYTLEPPERKEVCKIIDKRNDYSGFGDIAADIVRETLIYKILNCDDANDLYSYLHLEKSNLNEELKEVVREILKYENAKNKSVFSDFEKMDMNVKYEILQNIISGYKENITSFYDLFAISIINYEFSKVDNWGEISNYIDGYYKDILTDFDYKKYSKSSYRSQIDQSLVNKNFESLSKLCEYIDDYKPSSQSSQGSSSGFGSQSSSSSSKGKNSSFGGGLVALPPITSQEEVQTSGNNTNFNDLAGYEWADKQITYLYENKIIDGVGDNKFSPSQNITREAFVKMLVQILKIEDAVDINFADVDKNSWAYSYIAKAVNAGIVSGVSDTRFGMGVNITREDMAVLISRIFKDKDVESQNDFADFDDVSDYAKEHLLKISALKIINGYEDKTFKPKALCTRAEAAVVIYKTAMLLKEYN